jgi:arginyl-tRNA--protein-N-Asp/Glu arginylyltransferase
VVEFQLDSLSTAHSLLSTAVPRQIPLQLYSHYPAPPPPLPVALWESGDHPCVYLPGRSARMRAILADEVPSEIYHQFMDANFRRSGKLIYQPSCASCRECKSLRVPVANFSPNKSQRRCWKRNQDLNVQVHSQSEASDEKFELYSRYQRDWHGKEGGTVNEFAEFLYASPVDTIEFEYRDPQNRLLGVGICDVCSMSLSSVYYFFDPRESSRSLGTFGAMQEIEYARQRAIPYYYLGYWIGACAAMNYKASFRPHEVLMTDGKWR